MSRTGSLALAAVVAMSAFAQDRRPTVADLSPVERQTADFYGAIAAGRGVQIAWSADRTEIPLDGEVTVTLTVRNAANPDELVRPDLSKRDDMAKDFQVSDAPSSAPNEFAYRLRPRAVGTFALPRLKYRYYRPDFSDGRRFPTAYAEPLIIAVVTPKPKATPVVVPVPIEAPESFFTLAADPPPYTNGRHGWLLPVALVPLVVAGWVFAWRRLFPDAARLATLRRSRAARVALGRLAAAHSAPDGAEVAAAAVRTYLATRFGVPPAAQTPAEVAAGLRTVGRDALAPDAEAYLRACDAARFADPSDNEMSLATRAEALVATWEEIAG